VLENMNVENILIGSQTKECKQINDLVKIAKQKNIRLIGLEKGDEILIEKNIKMEVIWPNNKKLITSNELNNNSLVFKLKYKTFSIIFTGDIEGIAENEILKQEVEFSSSILKVAHHGSKTSSTEEFLKEVNPKIALIGVGKNNKFGHPSKEVLDRLNRFKTKVYRTDLNGEIEIKVNKKGEILVKTKL